MAAVAVMDAQDRARPIAGPVADQDRGRVARLLHFLIPRDSPMATQTPPAAAAFESEPTQALDAQGLDPSGHGPLESGAPASLIELAIRREEGVLADMGPFVAVTAPHTGRSPNDKFLVREPATDGDVDWGKVNQPMAEEHFDRLLADVRTYLNGAGDLFVQDLFCGADPRHRLSVRYVTPNAWHARVRPQHVHPARTIDAVATFQPNFTVLHAPEFQADARAPWHADRHVHRASPRAPDDPDRRHALRGRAQEGDVHGHELPDAEGRRPVHALLGQRRPAKATPRSSSASRARARPRSPPIPSASLIGDDEHGWSDERHLQLRGRLLREGDQPVAPRQEPDIYATTQMFGTILENVVARSRHATRALRRPVDHREHARVVSRCHYIRNHVPSGRGGHPRNVVFLTADAFGVLPPIARLTREQAMYYFLSGLHRQGRRHGARGDRAAGDVQRPASAPSSSCGIPTKYAEMLGELIDRHGSHVWLVNTGLERRPIRRGRADEARPHAGHGARRPRRGAGRTPRAVDPVFGLGRPGRGAGRARRGADTRARRGRMPPRTTPRRRSWPRCSAGTSRSSGRWIRRSSRRAERLSGR